MELEVSQTGAPVADSGAPAPAAQPQTLLSSQEQEQLKQLPDFLVNTTSEQNLLAAAGLEAPPAAQAAPAAEPAPAPAVEAAPVAAPAPAPAPVADVGPDPVQSFLEKQMAVLEKQGAALAALEARLNPPPAVPQPKKLEDMTEEEAFVHLLEQRMGNMLAQALKPFEEERAAAKAAQAAAQKEAEFKALSGSIYQAADAAVASVVGADKLAGLSAEDRAAVADVILATQAANAEATDAQGRIVGMSAAQAAAVVKDRYTRMARLFGVSAAQAPAVTRAPVAQAQRVGAPGAVSPVPYTDPQGNQVMVPDAKTIHSKYGGSTDKILDAIADRFSKARPQS